MQKILITGASGFVGSRVVKALQHRYNLLTPTHREFDITNPESIEKFTADNERFPLHERNISISLNKIIEASNGAIKFSNTLDGLKKYNSLVTSI